MCTSKTSIFRTSKIYSLIQAKCGYGGNGHQRIYDQILMKGNDDFIEYIGNNTLSDDDDINNDILNGAEKKRNDDAMDDINYCKIRKSIKW